MSEKENNKTITVKCSYCGYQNEAVISASDNLLKIQPKKERPKQLAFFFASNGDE